MTRFGDIAGGVAIGYFLDYSSLSVKRRARLSWIILMALNLGLWVWAATVTKLLESHRELLEPHRPGIDWTSGSIFGKVFGLAVVFEFTAFATQTLLYWLISLTMTQFTNEFFIHSTTSVKGLSYSLLHDWSIPWYGMCWASCCICHQVFQHVELAIHWIEYRFQ